MKKVAIINSHGLGDTVMLTPALRGYQRLHPKHLIYVLTLKRFGKSSRGVLSGLDFVEETYPILDDPWNDFPNYEIGFNAIIEQGKKFAKENGIDEVLPLYCRPYSDTFSIQHHKIFRFAKDLGVTYRSLKDTVLDARVTLDRMRDATTIMFRYPQPHTILHLEGGNPSKSLGYSQVPWAFEEGTVFEIGSVGKSIRSNHIHLGLPDMELTKALVSSCDRVIAIDSIIMHLAFAFMKPVDALFVHTPIIQVCPLNPSYTSVRYGAVHPLLEKGMKTALKDAEEYISNGSCSRN